MKVLPYSVSTVVARTWFCNLRNWLWIRKKLFGENWVKPVRRVLLIHSVLIWF